MAHKNKRGEGFFPEGDNIILTAPQNLGLSLLNASVKNVTGEVVINAPLTTKPEEQGTKPINYKQLDWAFKEFMKIQEDMISKGQIDSAIKNLEEALNERLSIYPAKDAGVWQITQLLSDITIKTAVRHLNNNQPDQSLNYLKQAKKFTEPLPNSDWSENPEWISMRKSVFKNMALYHQKKEDWAKALDYFKISLKLDNSIINPDPLGAANTSLTCAVILSKLNRYAESIDFAQNCMNSIEDLAKIDKQIPLSEYKQQITRNGSRVNGGKQTDHDKMMTTYSICMHLLGKNLANLKYFKEARVFLQRAQYVALNMMGQPKEDLVGAIMSDITNLNQTLKKPLQDQKDNSSQPMTIEDTQSALNTIKTNLTNSSYSLAADFQEQKALLDELLKNDQKVVTESKKQDDKALQYVKHFIEEKKKKEQVSIDEYRTKIAKDFDVKQKEFMEKQQVQKNKKLVSEKAKTKAKPKKDLNTSQSQEPSSIKERPKLPINRSSMARSAGLADQNMKPGDFEGEERKTRIKKQDQNLAAEGAKLDNLNLKYSSEKGSKQFYQNRRMNIEKVNEKLGYFGGGILDQEEAKEVVLVGGQESTEYYEGNPFEDQNLLADQSADKKYTPNKKGKNMKETASAVKLPPVKGYKLDSLGLGDAGDTIIKKSMEGGYGSDNRGGGGGYKNPHTRKLIENLENKDYGKFTRAKSFKSENLAVQQKPEEEKKASPKYKSIREIPTYQPPPEQDWREEFRKDDLSEDELPDTKMLIEKLNKAAVKKDVSIFEEEDDDSFTQQDLPVLKNNAPAKPPKANIPLSQQSSISSNLKFPNIGKRFQEDGKSPEPKPALPKQNQSSPPSQIGKGSKLASDTDRLSQKSKINTGLRNVKTDNSQPPPQQSNTQRSGAYVPPNKRNKSQQKQPSSEENAKKKQALDQEEGKALKRPFDGDRLNTMSQPKQALKPPSKQEQRNEGKKAIDKAKALHEGVQRGKPIDMESYLDRDVPVMNQKTKKKLERRNSVGADDDSRQKDFDTSYQPNKKGLFNSDVQSDRRSSRRSADKRKGDESSEVNKKLRENGEEIDENRGGLMKSIQMQKSGQMNLRGLREIETRAAIAIQRLAKGFLTRKWFLNYMMRKKLGVPFSGIEFTENIFLRQFNKPNQQLHSATLQTPQMIEVVNSQGDQKNMLKKSFRHGKSITDQKEHHQTDRDKSPERQGPKRLKKGTTPQQLMDNLQKDILANGLDAYSQFKRLGVDALTDDNGQPKFEQSKPTDEEDFKSYSPRTVSIALDPLERMVPRWRGEKAAQFLEVKEVGQYLDRVSKMKEYDEKHKEFVKMQGYQDQARQLKKHEVSTMASFAKAQGVFNRNPNQRNEIEDAEDYDPLAPQFYADRKPNPSGDGGGGGNGGGGGGGGGDKSDNDDAEKKKKGVTGLRSVPYKEEDGSIPIRMYQDFSREMIVFYKGIREMPIKWSIQAGVAFLKDRKYYLPIRIYGEPQHSRNTIVVYVMNLELLKIPSDYFQYNTHNFESIWPFILYLFNNWVRHQVQMIELTKNKPLFGPDEFLNPKEQEVLTPRTRYEALTQGRSPRIHDNDYFITEDKPPKELADREVLNGVNSAKNDYDEMLNFSSEIEYDERFDFEKYKTLVRPEVLVDRTQPIDKRTSAVEMMIDNRKQLFQAYRMSLQQEKKLIPVTNDIKIGSTQKSQKLLYQMEQDELNRVEEDEFLGGKSKKKVMLKLDDIYEPIAIKNQNPFAFFLEMHYVPLPNTQTGQYQLLRRLQEKTYNVREKGSIVLPVETIVIMNEERRKRIGLLPLTVVDYNCIDRAALKIKIILECLYMRRQLNGWALVPRDVKEAYIDKEWQRRKLKMARQVTKLESFSIELIKAFGHHIVYAKQFNEQALQIEKSMTKIDEYKKRNQLRLPTFNEREEDKLKDITSHQSLKTRGPPTGQGSPTKSRKENSMSAALENVEQKSFDFLDEQAIVISTGRSGKQLGDTTTFVEVEDPNKGLVEATRNERLRSQMGSSQGQRFEAENHLQNYIAERQLQEQQELQDPDFYRGDEPDVQDYIRDGEIFEQGIIRIKGTLYMVTLVFKRIQSNYENMKLLIEDRFKEHMPKSQSHQVEMLRNYKGHLRMRSKLCEFVSLHPDIRKYDAETYRNIKQSEKNLLESEMSLKVKTQYKTYLEIKINTKMSDSIWDDSFNMVWEKFEEFYAKFGIEWRLHDLLSKRRMSFRDRFTFFNLFGNCISIRDTLVQYHPETFDFEAFKFDEIFLKLDQMVEFRKQFTALPFYFDDFLKNGFDETKYDKAITPFYNIDQAKQKLNARFAKSQKEGRLLEAAEIRPDPAYGIGSTQEEIERFEEEDEAMTQGIRVKMQEGSGKPELLLDEATKHYLLDNPDNQNMFNLTLTNFPQSDGMFLGKIQLGHPDSYRNNFNLRVDYYSVGFIPTIQIKAYNCIYPEAFEMKVYHKQIIKSFIRICNQSALSMIVNQLQSAITLGKKVTGRYMKLNFFKHSLYLSSGIGTQHGQDFINMAICNENLIRTMLNDKYRQFAGVMFFDNLGGRNLVTVSEFEIDMFQQEKGSQNMIHMNKHQSQEELKRENGRIQVSVNTPPEKRYQKVKLWKINLFNIQNSKSYEAVISYDDLHNYYETEFAFKAQAHLQKPDLLRLLSDYLRTLYIYRTKVGPVLYWRLPMYKKPIDPITGLSQEVPSNHLYKLKMLDLYHALQSKIDGLNKYDSGSGAAVSIDQMKAKHSKREPPSLSLRAKLVAEKELPVYKQSQSLRILKVTSSINEILLQRPKIFKLNGKSLLCHITVMLHQLMECWLWQLYFPLTQRTFIAVLYPSDLFNMNSDLFGGQNKGRKNQSSTLWIEMIKRVEIQRNPANDIILVIDSFKEPLKEMLFQDHVFNENAQDIFFMEIILKTNNNFVTDISTSFQPLDSQSNKLNEWVVHTRAFSLTRNVWIKDHMPLAEIIKILKQENYITDNLKLLYYSMIRDAAILLSHKIVFSDEAKTSEVKKKKLTFDIKSITVSKEEMERVKKQHFRDLRKKRTSIDGLTEAQQAGLKTEKRNQIDQNKIFYQAVLSQNPTQVCTITYSDVRDMFIYRLYRASDSSNYEKRIPASEVQRTCAPHYRQMMRSQMLNEIGKRISQYYKKDMLVASLMSYFKIQQEQKAQADILNQSQLQIMQINPNQQEEY